MDYPKVPQEINNIVEDNVKLLAQIFPSAVKDGQVDFEALKEELGQFEEVDKEKYELTWAGKQDAKKKAQEDVYNRTLKYIKEDSKNPETTENIYIEGDNLEVLKMLRPNYYGAIKMIYIDPPYNTGNDFVYNDNFDMSGKESDITEGTRDDEGNPLQKNQQSTNRFHANWLNMMYPRLKIAKELLTDDGVIFISIDDNEVENLKKICNDVLGEKNFIACVIWERAFSPVNLKKHFSESHDYIICYAKNIDNLTCNGLPRSEEANDRYSNPDNDPRGNWASADLSVGPAIQSNIYEITTPSGRKVFPPSGYSWRLNKERYFEFLKDDRIWFGDKGNGVPRIKRFLSEVKQGITPMTIWKHQDVGHSQKASQDLKKLFDNNAYFTYPKPIELIKRLLELYSNSDSLILDFFSGSATTAHAVMQLNAEDDGNRKFIMVQVAEETDKNSESYKAGYQNICEIGKERIRRAGEKIKQEIEAANAQLKLGEEPRQVPDIGFKVFRTADTNIKWNLYDALGQLDTSAMTHTPDLADFTMGFSDIDVVYEVMLRQKDVPLSSTLETLTDISSRTYLYGSAYLVCLETEITEKLIDKLAALDPLPIKFVFRDSAFKDDINLKDETFRRLKNLIERNSGLAKKTYTVEFI
ncbi:site-specific DNA-methyltransferase [Dehalobacter restrictus]|uniref:Site-specific DNA-methyltransferase n=1 Tax=Dehalobacter restrictus TaxID=55583 RepID=A0A857DJ99_9FIRM|nr:site-specific DNA-methyltransferase [Dehalobacter restrictus]QHA01037.1 site-specific DNA-methyltransferase [Dehalobacter restrictus]